MENKNTERRNILEVVFILDASGSMHALTDDTIGGFNSLLAEQKAKAADGNVLVSTVTFNDSSRVVHDRLAVADVPELTGKDYQASGCTALLDAMGDAIRHTDTIHKYARPEDVPLHTLFFITTDGMENASRRYSSDEIKAMVKAHQEKGWEFVFVAANIDAVETAARYGIREDRAVEYLNDKTGNAVKFKAMNRFFGAMACREAPCEAELSASIEEIRRDVKARKR